MQSLKYACSFFRFVAIVPDPEVIGKTHRPNFLPAEPRNLTSSSMGPLCDVDHLRLLGLVQEARKISTFFKYAAFEILLITALFDHRTLKMTGPLFNFNGHFFFSVQLFALFLLTALLLNGTRLDVRPALACAICALLPLSMFAAPKGFSNTERRARDKFSREAPPSERRFDLPPYFCAV